MRLAPGILNNIMNRGSFRQGQNIFNQAATGMTQAFQGTAGSAGAPNIAAFQTPYTQNVINRTQQDIARQQAMSMNDLGAQATAAGAFGGSRHGVAQGVMAGEYGRMAGDIAAQQRQAGYQSALQAAQQQQQQQLAAAGQMGSLAQGAVGMGQGTIGMQNAFGSQQQAINQAIIDAGRQQYAGFQNAPYQAIALNTGTLAQTPYGQTQTESYNPSLFDWLSLGANAYGAYQGARR
jgi:hypothetical protein